MMRKRLILSTILWTLVNWYYPWILTNNYNRGRYQPSDIKPLLNQVNLKQLVKAPTRGQRILDISLLMPHICSPRLLLALVLWYQIMLLSICLPRVPSKTVRRNVRSRDVRDHNKLAMTRAVESLNWDDVTSIDDPV